MASHSVFVSQQSEVIRSQSHMSDHERVPVESMRCGCVSSDLVLLAGVRSWSLTGVLAIVLEGESVRAGSSVVASSLLLLSLRSLRSPLPSYAPARTTDKLGAAHMARASSHAVEYVRPSEAHTGTAAASAHLRTCSQSAAAAVAFGRGAIGGGGDGAGSDRGGVNGAGVRNVEIGLGKAVLLLLLLVLAHAPRAATNSAALFVRHLLDWNKHALLYVTPFDAHGRQQLVVAVEHAHWRCSSWRGTGARAYAAEQEQRCQLHRHHHARLHVAPRAEVLVPFALASAARASMQVEVACFLFE